MLCLYGMIITLTCYGSILTTPPMLIPTNQEFTEDHALLAVETPKMSNLNTPALKLCGATLDTETLTPLLPDLPANIPALLQELVPFPLQENMTLFPIVTLPVPPPQLENSIAILKLIIVKKKPEEITPLSVIVNLLVLPQP